MHVSVCLKWTASQTPDVLLTSSVQVKGEILPSEGLELSKVLNRPLAPELFSSGSVRICSARESFWFLCSFRGIWHFLYFRLYAVLSINLMYIYLFFYVFHLIWKLVSTTGKTQKRTLQLLISQLRLFISDNCLWVYFLQFWFFSINSVFCKIYLQDINLELWEIKLQFLEKCLGILFFIFFLPQN